MMKDTSETKKQFIDTVSNKYRPITVGRLDDYGRLLAKKNGKAKDSFHSMPIGHMGPAPLFYRPIGSWWVM